jgi:hypothetical protein
LLLDPGNHLSLGVLPLPVVAFAQLMVVFGSMQHLQARTRWFDPLNMTQGRGSPIGTANGYKKATLVSGLVSDCLYLAAEVVGLLLDIALLLTLIAD